MGKPTTQAIMTLTSAEIELILPEIAQIAGRGVIQRVLEVDAQTRILQLRVPGDTHYLCLCTQPQVTRIHFIRQRTAQPPTPTAFTMQLRRWLQGRSEEHTSELQSRPHLVCRLLLEKKKKKT